MSRDFSEHDPHCSIRDGEECNCSLALDDDAPALHLYPVPVLALLEQTIVEIERFVALIGPKDKTRCGKYLCLLLGHIEYLRDHCDETIAFESREITRACEYEYAGGKPMRLP